MIGTGARTPTLAFLGWFGPRGLASIVFAVLVLEEGGLPHDGLILTTTYVTIGLSVLAHGLTAAPLANRYAAWYESHPREALGSLERADVREVRWRFGVGHSRAPEGVWPRRISKYWVVRRSAALASSISGHCAQVQAPTSGSGAVVKPTPAGEPPVTPASSKIGARVGAGRLQSERPFVSSP
jgi:NhaP-type Na+/H+ or K+/H+ antiporter